MSALATATSGENKGSESDNIVAEEVRSEPMSLKFVTAVTHISQWSPPTDGGTALVCIGVLEYSQPTSCDQNDLYLMKRYPTVAPVNFDGKQVTNANQKPGENNAVAISVEV